MNKHLIDPNVLCIDRRRRTRAENHCVLYCILMRIELLRNNLTDMKRKGPLHFKKKILDLNYEAVDNLQDGISAKQFNALERLNSPIPLRLVRQHPTLKIYNGFAINLFRLQHDKKERNFKLFPVKLSRFHNDQNYLQIDLLQEPVTRTSEEHVETQQKHCLLIRSLPRLLTAYNHSFSSRKFRRIHNPTYICRGCMKLFQYKLAFKKHVSDCGVKGHMTSNKRLNKNQYIHKTHYVDKFSETTRRRVKRFTRGELYKRLKAPLFAG